MTDSEPFVTSREGERGGDTGRWPVDGDGDIAVDGAKIPDNGKTAGCLGARGRFPRAVGKKSCEEEVDEGVNELDVDVRVKRPCEYPWHGLEDPRST